MYHQISKRRSVSQEQNTLLKSQSPGNVGYREKAEIDRYGIGWNLPRPRHGLVGVSGDLRGKAAIFEELAKVFPSAQQVVEKWLGCCIT